MVIHQASFHPTREPFVPTRSLELVMRGRRLYQSALVICALAVALTATSDVVAQALTPDSPNGVYVAGPLSCIRASSVQLAISGQGDALRAVFSFSMPAEPNRTYAYRLRGFYDARRREIRLTPERWDVEYQGYSMASIEMRFDARGGGGRGEMKGTIDYAGCRELTIRRDPGLPIPTALQSAPQAMSFLALTDRRLPSIRSVTGDAQCELLVRWLARYTEEGRLGPLDHGAWLLLGDEDFVPLFGQPYETTTRRWRTNLFSDVVRRCLSNTHPLRVDGGDAPTTYAEQLGRFGQFLSCALDQPCENGLSPERITLTLGQRRETRDRLVTMLANAEAAPATTASIDELRIPLKAIDHDAHYFFFTHHRGLWPSEQQAFARALRTRVAVLSGHVADSWLAELRRGGHDITTVQRVSSEIETYADFLAELEPAYREQTVQAAFASFNEMIDRAMEPSLDALRNAPASVVGAVPRPALSRRA